nr:MULTISPECIES: hypothetical protein [Carboxydocella]
MVLIHQNRPKEVEDVLAQLPQVLEAAVFGVPHPDWGETVCVAVVLKPGMQLSGEEILRFCGSWYSALKNPPDNVRYQGDCLTPPV